MYKYAILYCIVVFYSRILFFFFQHFFTKSYLPQWKVLCCSVFRSITLNWMVSQSTDVVVHVHFYIKLQWCCDPVLDQSDQLWLHRFPVRGHMKKKKKNLHKMLSVTSTLTHQITNKNLGMDFKMVDQSNFRSRWRSKAWGALTYETVTATLRHTTRKNFRPN